MKSQRFDQLHQTGPDEVDALLVCMCVDYFWLLSLLDDEASSGASCDGALGGEVQHLIEGEHPELPHTLKEFNHGTKLLILQPTEVLSEGVLFQHGQFGFGCYSLYIHKQIHANETAVAVRYTSYNNPNSPNA